MLWSLLLKKLIHSGHLTVIDAHGRTKSFGRPGEQPDCTIRLHDASLHHKLFYNPGLYLGESYTDGTLTIEQGTLEGLMDLFGMNLANIPGFLWTRVEEALAPIVTRLQQYNAKRAAKANVAHHYDLSEKLYRLFLDEDMQYSCAYFDTPDDTLEHAQLRKKQRIAAKLLLEPGLRVLDVGCGWGGMALYLAREHGVEVTGITLSEEQHRVATARAKAAGLEDRVQFHLRDYREETGVYDRVVSVGMFEHVGIDFYPAFFAMLKGRLKPDGVGLLHSIGRMDGPGVTNPWIRKYIFPGGYSPALSEVMPVAEKSGLWVTDIEILRLHYAYTLRHWWQRLAARRAEVEALYDARFYRMWEYYLKACEMSFIHMGIMVFQLQFSRRIDAVPITRDYMYP